MPSISAGSFKTHIPRLKDLHAPSIFAGERQIQYTQTPSIYKRKQLKRLTETAKQEVSDTNR